MVVSDKTPYCRPSIRQAVTADSRLRLGHEITDRHATNPQVHDRCRAVPNSDGKVGIPFRGTAVLAKGRVHLRCEVLLHIKVVERHAQAGCLTHNPVPTLRRRSQGGRARSAIAIAGWDRVRAARCGRASVRLLPTALRTPGDLRRSRQPHAAGPADRQSPPRKEVDVAALVPGADWPRQAEVGGGSQNRLVSAGIAPSECLILLRPDITCLALFKQLERQQACKNQKYCPATPHQQTQRFTLHASVRPRNEEGQQKKPDRAAHEHAHDT